MTNDTDMIRRMDAVQACQAGPSDEWSRATRDGYNQAATDIAMNMLRIPAVTPAVIVEPLGWFEVERGNNGYGKWNAEGYTVQKIEGLFLLSFDGESRSTWRFPTPEAAKAAAQADYEARILSALTIHPADPLSDPRVVALVEAATKIASLQKSTLTDVGSAHSNRGAGASGWMREDDRDFMRDLENAFTSVTAAIHAIGGEGRNVASEYALKVAQMKEDFPNGI